MPYKVQLAYFRLTGKFLAFAECVVDQDAIARIWEEIHELRRLGRLPGLRVNAGRDLFILVDVIDHPQRELHMVIPPFVNEDDITPVRVPTGQPFVRVPLEEIPTARTTTRDVVKLEETSIAADEEVTPRDTSLPVTDDYDQG